MQPASERRIEMRDYLSQVRGTTIKQLVQKFGVSRRTIQYDLDYLETELCVPILRDGGNGGGIRVIDGWYANRNYFTETQEAFLMSLMPGLQPEQKVQMEEILFSFAKPKQKETVKR